MKLDLLNGTTIIDFTRLLPGPVATNLLAQMGAKVIKIESPKRMDYARSIGKQIHGASMLFHQLNHNKELVMIDYSSPAGKNELIDLIKEADVLIEQFRPGAMSAWGLGYKEVRAINSKIIYVSFTGYGQTGAYASEAGHDLNFLAYSGIMSLQKDENGKPIVSDTQFADISGAYMTIIAIQAALLKRSRTATGSFVDVSMCDAVLPFLTIPYALHCGGQDYSLHNTVNGKTAVNYACYECADGKWLAVAAMELKFWNNLCHVLNKSEWKRRHQKDLMNTNFPKAEVESHFKTKTRDEWIELLTGKDVCTSPILDIEELENSSYHQERNSFEEIVVSKDLNFKTVRLPFRIRNSK
ncbi:MAG: CoA transferase [Bacteroidota bacterium]